MLIHRRPVGHWRHIYGIDTILRKAFGRANLRLQGTEVVKPMIAAQGTDAILDEASIKCRYGRLLEVLGKPHTLGILYSIISTRSPWRFTQLQKHLELQPKTLAMRLQELVKFGLVARRSYNEIPPRVDYQLTQKGRDLGKLFNELQAWTSKYDNIEQPTGGRTKAVEKRSDDLDPPDTIVA